MKSVFKAIRKEVSEERVLMGTRCVVTSSTVDAKFGQVEIRGNGAPITLSAVTEGEILKKGDEAVILSEDNARGICVVTKLELEV